MGFLPPPSCTLVAFWKNSHPQLPPPRPPFQAQAAVYITMTTHNRISSLRRVSEANTTWYDSEASHDDIPKDPRVVPCRPLEKREVSPGIYSPKLRNAASHLRRTSPTTHNPQAKAIQHVFRPPVQSTKSLDSTASGTPQCGFRQFASSDFLSRTSSVASSKAGSSKSGESTTSVPSVMLSVLQSAKMHQLSKCHSADKLVPNIMPICLALNTNSASLLPRSPGLLNSPDSNDSQDKQSAVITDAIMIKQKKNI